MRSVIRLCVIIGSCGTVLGMGGTATRAEDCPFSDKTVCVDPSAPIPEVDFCDSLIDLTESPSWDLLLADGSSVDLNKFHPGRLRSRLQMSNGADLQCSVAWSNEYYAGYCFQKFDEIEEYSLAYKTYVRDMRRCAIDRGYHEFKTNAGAATGNIGLRGSYGFAKKEYNVFVYSRGMTSGYAIGFQWKITK